MNRKLYKLTACLLGLVLFSVWYASGLLAKYTSTSESSDDARVASFDVQFEVSGPGTYTQPLAVTIAPTNASGSGTTASDSSTSEAGSSSEITIRITDKSEVAVTYIITIERRTDNLPDSLTFQINGTNGVTFQKDNSTTSNNKWIFTSTSASGADSTSTCTLQTIWTADTSASDGEDSNLAYMGMVDYVTITLEAVQCD